jgi:hypothetical protein
MNLSDLYSGSAISGMASGALTGGLVGGVPGAVIGGLGGGLVGASANSTRNDAAAAQQQNLQDAMAKMRASSSSAYQQHIQNLDKAMSYYGPAQQAWDRAYGTGTPAATGQGSWKGAGG